MSNALHITAEGQDGQGAQRDLSMAETAVALGVSLSAAKSRASRATAALAALLDDTEDAHVG